MIPPREKGSETAAHECCPCATHNGLSCCAPGHPLDREQAAAVASTRELGS